MQNDVSAGKIVISGDTTGAIAAIKEAQSSLAKLEVVAKDSQAGINAALKKTESSLGAVGKAWDQVKGFAAGYLGLNLASGIFEQTRAFSNLDFSLKGVFGSQEEAARQFEYLTQVSDNLGLSLQGAARGYVGIASAAKGTSIEGDKARAIFEGFSGTMAASGRTAEQINSVMLQLTQAISKNSLQWEDLRILQEQFPGINQRMAAALGLTDEAFIKLVHDGGVTRDVLAQAGVEFQKGVGRVDNLEASVSRLQTAWQRLLNSLGDSSAFKTALDSLTTLVSGLGEASEKADAFWSTLFVDQADVNQQRRTSREIANRALDPETSKRFEDEKLRRETAAIDESIRKVTEEQQRNIKASFEFLVKQKLSPAQAAGIVGNLMQESGVNPGVTNGIGATGVAQWLGDRKDALQQQSGWQLLETQLAFLVKELQTTEQGALRALLKTQTPEEAAAVFSKRFERPGAAEANIPARQEFARNVFNTFNEQTIAEWEQQEKTRIRIIEEESEQARKVEEKSATERINIIDEAYTSITKEEEKLAVDRSSIIEDAYASILKEEEKLASDRASIIQDAYDEIKTAERSAKIGALELKVQGFGPDQIEQINQLTGDQRALYEERFRQLNEQTAGVLTPGGEDNQRLINMEAASRGLIDFRNTAKDTFADVSGYAASAMLGIQRSIAETLANGVGNWSDFGDAVLNILKNFVANVAASGLSDLLSQLVGIGINQGTGKYATTGSGIIGAIGSIAGLVFHEGGEVGKTSNTRIMPAVQAPSIGFSAPAAAAKAVNTKVTAALGHDEVLAVLQRGEIVLNHAQQLDVARTGKLPKFHTGGLVGGASSVINNSSTVSPVNQTTNISVSVAGDGKVGTAARENSGLSLELARAADAAVKAVLAKELRAGGMMRGGR